MGVARSMVDIAAYAPIRIVNPAAQTLRAPWRLVQAAPSGA
jgi:hypothetical protein